MNNRVLKLREGMLSILSITGGQMRIHDGLNRINMAKYGQVCSRTQTYNVDF